jgi:hypothetical protein
MKQDGAEHVVIHCRGYATRVERIEERQPIEIDASLSPRGATSPDFGSPVVWGGDTGKSLEGSKGIGNPQGNRVEDVLVCQHPNIAGQEGALAPLLDLSPLASHSGTRLRSAGIQI